MGYYTYQVVEPHFEVQAKLLSEILHVDFKNGILNLHMRAVEVGSITERLVI